MVKFVEKGDELFLLAELRSSFTWKNRQLRVSVRRGGSGRPLLALAGFLAGAGTFRYLVAPLRQKFELVIPEVEFSGAAELVTDTVQLADMLGALADHLGLTKAHWLAQGELALGAMQLGLERPELMERLVVLAPPLELQPGFRLRHLGLIFGPCRRLWASRANLKPYAMARRLLDGADPALYDSSLIRQEARRLETLPAALALAEVIGNRSRKAFTRPLLDNVHERVKTPRPYPVPLHIIFGEKDRHCHRRCRPLLARAFPGSQVTTLPDAGWLPQLEQPHAVAEVVSSSG